MAAITDDIEIINFSNPEMQANQIPISVGNLVWVTWSMNLLEARDNTQRNQLLLQEHYLKSLM